MFTLGFTKIADFGSNNQGLEYKMSDDNNTTSNVGPGGMSPQGIESYQPIPKLQEATPKNIKNKNKKKQEDFDVASFLMQKGASVRGNAGASDQKDVPGFTNNTTQALKYDSSTVDATPDEMMSSIKDELARIKKFRRLEKK